MTHWILIALLCVDQAWGLRPKSIPKKSDQWLVNKSQKVDDQSDLIMIINEMTLRRSPAPRMSSKRRPGPSSWVRRDRRRRPGNFQPDSAGKPNFWGGGRGISQNPEGSPVPTKRGRDAGYQPSRPS